MVCRKASQSSVGPLSWLSLGYHKGWDACGIAGKFFWGPGMFAACPSSVVCGAALKILRCAQDDRSGNGAYLLRAELFGGHPLSVAFRRQLPRRGSHDWCGASLPICKNRCCSLGLRLHPHPGLPSRGGGLSAGQDGEVNRGCVLVRRESYAPHPFLASPFGRGGTAQP